MWNSLQLEKYADWQKNRQLYDQKNQLSQMAGILWWTGLIAGSMGDTVSAFPLCVLGFGCWVAFLLQPIQSP